MNRLFEFFLAMLAAMLLGGNAWADNIQIAVYGDSLTSGYNIQSEEAFATRLERKLKAAGFSDVEVTNLSVPERTTGEGLDHIATILDHRPDIVILELGTNDALRGIGIKNINSNLGNIITKLLQNKIYILMVGTKAPASMGYAYGYQLEEIYKGLAENFNISLYPDALAGIRGNQDLTQADDLHPNAKGEAAMVENIYPMVDAAMRWALQYRQWQQQNRDMAPSMSPVPPALH